jgi:hypothetical protein
MRPRSGETNGYGWPGDASFSINRCLSESVMGMLAVRMRRGSSCISCDPDGVAAPSVGATNDVC